MYTLSGYDKKISIDIISTPDESSLREPKTFQTHRKPVSMLSALVWQAF